MQELGELPLYPVKNFQCGKKQITYFDAHMKKRKEVDEEQIRKLLLPV